MNVNDVFIRPVLTEKSNALRTGGSYVFVVDSRANKVEIVKAAQKIFGVRVESCRIHVRKPKYKMLRTRRGYGKSAHQKIAILTLKTGDKIEELEL